MVSPSSTSVPVNRPSWSRWPPSGPDVLVEQRVHHRGEGEVEREVVAVGIAVGEVEHALRLTHRVAEAVRQLEVAERTVGERAGARTACSTGSRRAGHRCRPTRTPRPSTRPGWAGRTGTSTPRACAPAPRTRTTPSRSRTGRRSSAGGTRRQDDSCRSSNCVSDAYRAFDAGSVGSAGAAEEAAGAGAGVDAVAAGDLAAHHGGDVAVGVLEETAATGGEVVGEPGHAAARAGRSR